MIEHPFDDNSVETLANQYWTHPASSNDESQNEEQIIKTIHSQLDQVQFTLESHLMTILGNIYSPQTDDQVRILTETPDRYYIEDNAGVFWPYLNRSISDLGEVIRHIHQRTVQAEINTDIDSPDQYVVAKPLRWREAEWLIETFLISLADRGMSAAQALDYFMTEKRGIRKGQWGDSRGTSAEGIRQNVKGAEDALDDYQNEEGSTEVPSYFERVYRGETDGKKNKVTADYGRLEPRTDLEEAIRYGRFNWGKSGKRATQLSIALLADALGREEAKQHYDEFSSVVSELDDEWILKASEIYDWSNDTAINSETGE